MTPILAYHSMRIHGTAYAENDLVAFDRDLELIAAMGLHVVPLESIARSLLDERTELKNVVGLSFDDAPDFDFHDLAHPSHGPQRSVLNILRDFRARHGIDAHVTSFAIVSPEARAELDKSCMVGRGWWRDEWWPRAVESGFMHVGNHSWDHNHDALPDRLSLGASARGTFHTIDTAALAEAEIRRATEYLRGKAPNPGDTLFAYPYGESNRYLVEDYLPLCGRDQGLIAAFTAEPAYVSTKSCRWRLPRFVCGRDWKSPEALRSILEGARPEAA